MTRMVNPSRNTAAVSNGAAQYRGRLLILTVCAAAALALHFTGVGCPIYHFTGILCPGCGLTRAVLAALRLDWKAAFAANPMFVTLPILFLYFWFGGKVFRSRILNGAVLAAVAVGFILTWLFRCV